MNISSYLATIISAFLLLIIIDIITPNGKMAKSIKIISTIIIFYLMFTPIISLINSNFDYDINPNQEVISSINNRSMYYSKLNFERYIKSELDVSINVEINTKTYNNELLVDYIEIYMLDDNIFDADENINIKEKIISFASNYFKIDSSKVVMYE